MSEKIESQAQDEDDGEDGGAPLRTWGPQLPGESDEEYSERHVGHFIVEGSIEAIMKGQRRFVIMDGSGVYLEVMPQQDCEDEDRERCDHVARLLTEDYAKTGGATAKPEPRELGPREAGLAWLTERGHWRFVLTDISTSFPEGTSPRAWHVELDRNDVARIIEAARMMDERRYNRLDLNIHFESIDAGGGAAAMFAPRTEGQDIAIMNGGLWAVAYNDHDPDETFEAMISPKRAVDAFPHPDSYTQRDEAGIEDDEHESEEEEA